MEFTLSLIVIALFR